MRCIFVNSDKATKVIAKSDAFPITVYGLSIRKKYNKNKIINKNNILK